MFHICLFQFLQKYFKPRHDRSHDGGKILFNNQLLLFNFLMLPIDWHVKHALSLTEGRTVIKQFSSK